MGGLTTSINTAPIVDGSSGVSSSGSIDESDPDDSVTRAQAKKGLQSGTCLDLKAKVSSTRVESGSQLMLKFRISNPATSRTAAAYSYILRVDMPSGVEYMAAKASSSVKNMRFQPVVGGGMVLWEMTPIPASKAKIGVTLNFVVDACRNSSTPLRFTASGVQVVNGAPICPVQPVIPEIAVYQNPKKSSKGCASSSSLSASIAAAGVPAFNAYGPAGTRCIESGTPSDITNPTLDECFKYCSLLLPQKPSYMNYLDGGNGEPRCSCLGRTCTLGLIASSGGASSRQRSRSLKRTTAAHGNDGILASTGDATVLTDIRELEDVRFGAYQITSLATSVPTDAPNCYVPDVFAQNVEMCEKELCDPLNWVEGLVRSNATSEPTAYDVCLGVCSIEALGVLPNVNQTSSNPALDAQRGGCQDRCQQKGMESFLCRQYCKDFPSDPVCPKPDCMTFASIEANPQYCDRFECRK